MSFHIEIKAIRSLLTLSGGICSQLEGNNKIREALCLIS